MNELQQIWLEAYRGYLNAASPFGEQNTCEYKEALDHAEAVVASLKALSEPS